ncbi:MAG: hypothetical protein OXM61_03015 [Candidatus Poribacteria bacterium]|nr:hypothetical protein [Candidatus Poribacteria bacterium]
MRNHVECQKRILPSAFRQAHLALIWTWKPYLILRVGFRKLYPTYEPTCERRDMCDKLYLTAYSAHRAYKALPQEKV